MRNKYILLSMLLVSGSAQATIGAVTTAVQNTVGDFLNKDAYQDALKKERNKGYWERLEERRNIPDTQEEWFELLKKTVEYIHQVELQTPATREPAVLLERIINDGWKNSWSKKNPGWYDIACGGAVVGGIAGIVVLAYWAAGR